MLPLAHAKLRPGVNMITVAGLTATAKQKIEAIRWDGILEKHEGPFTWADTFQYDDAEFMVIQDRPVLLPIGRDRHKNITILRCDIRDDGNSLTIFLKDTTYCDDSFEELFCGYVAVCDKVEGEEFFVAILLHEWYIINH